MTKTRSLLQLSVVLSLALAAGACSTIADLDPTGLLSDDAAPVPDSQFPDATAQAAPSDTSRGTTPDLASLPARPTAAPQAQQQQAAQSLAADGAQAQYSADALRGGAEAAAPPPGAAGPAIAAAAPPPSAAPSADADAPPSTDEAPSAQAPAAPAAAAPPPPTRTASAAAARPPGAQSAVPAVSGGRAAAAEPPPPSAAADLPPPSAAADVPPPSAAAAPVGPSAAPSGAEPAVPANTRVRGGAMMASSGVSDASLGFRPSSAPPLDPSINQWVAAPIVARYRQTASNAGISASSAAVPAARGAVVANAGAIPSGPAAIAAVTGGATPTAVVYFPGDGVVLSAAARGEIRSAVAAYKASGGSASIRVVGHASSRTANMPVEKHLETIFDKSQKRANAVAQELIHEGIPADKVLVEAVGDSQPVYYESMPRGEDGNRRAEIFVQG